MSRPLVIDASVVLRMMLPSREQAYLQKEVERLLEEGGTLCAPTLWVYEVTSALCKGVYFGRISGDQSRLMLARAQALGVQLYQPDDLQVSLAHEWMRRLHRAASYDSFYLALADTLSCELWTTDKRLVNAAAVPWVRLVSDSGLN